MTETPDSAGDVVVPGYLFLQAGEELGRLLRDRLVDILIEHGWRISARTDEGVLCLAPDCPLKVVVTDGSRIIVGRYFGDTVRRHPDPFEEALALSRSGWGRYIAIWSSGPHLSAFRDPSGGLPLMAWSVGSVSILGSDIPASVDALIPTGARIDWRQIDRMIRAPASAFRAPLTELDTVAPGDWLERKAGSWTSRAVWRPAAFARLQRAPDPVSLKRVIEGVLTFLLQDHDQVIGEASGGFDSSVIATTVSARSPSKVAEWVNYYSLEAESDERDYVEAVSRHMRVPISSRPKSAAALTRADLEALVAGATPAFYGLDVEYDADVARAMRRTGSSGVLTGQGGDAVFFQSGTPALVIDRVRRLGLRGLDLGFLYETSRWTRQSIWSLVEIALRDRFGRRQRRRDDDDPPPAATAHDHPWLSELEGLPPAKADQIRQLVNCQVFWSPCLRAMEGELLHPLLTQPVMERTLAIPADLLTAGGRGRALAHEAFRHRLPTELRERRGKGELSTYYGHVVLYSLPMLRELLIEGLLMQRQLIDRDETEALLDRDTLIWSGDYNLVLVRAVLEAWARRWSDRLRQARTPGDVPSTLAPKTAGPDSREVA